MYTTAAFLLAILIGQPRDEPQWRRVEVVYKRQWQAGDSRQPRQSSGDGRGSRWPAHANRPAQAGRLLRLSSRHSSSRSRRLIACPISQSSTFFACRDSPGLEARAWRAEDSGRWTNGHAHDEVWSLAWQTQTAGYEARTPARLARTRKDGRGKPRVPSPPMGQEAWAAWDALGLGRAAWSNGGAGVHGIAIGSRVMAVGDADPRSARGQCTRHQDSTAALDEGVGSAETPFRAARPATGKDRTCRHSVMALPKGQLPT
jgi:hypothetical protein